MVEDLVVSTVTGGNTIVVLQVEARRTGDAIIAVVLAFFAIAGAVLAVNVRADLANRSVVGVVIIVVVKLFI